MSCEHDCDRPPSFPATPWNRPGLSTFRYRIGTYASMRKHMLDTLVKAPMLVGWTHLEADEPGIALLEGAALVGDILTFYQQLYANETKLRSATWDDSVLALVQLTGYRPAPGLGGNTRFALEVAERTVVPTNFAFQAQLDGYDQPSIFENKKAIDAFPAFGSFHLYRRRLGLQPIKGATSLDIAKYGGKISLANRRAHEIEAGDRILILSTPLNAHEVLVVKDTEEHLDRVTIHFEGAVQEDHPFEVNAFKIGRTFRHYGANGPRTFSTFQENPPKTIMHDTVFKRHTSKTESVGKHYSTLFKRQMPLEGEVDDLAVGSRVICVGKVTEPEKRDFAFIRRIVKITPRDMLWASVTSPTSVLTLNKALRTDNLSSSIKDNGSGLTQSLSSTIQSVISEDDTDIEALEFGLPNIELEDFGLFEFDALLDPEKQDIRRLRIYETLSQKMVLRAPPKQVDSVNDGRVHYFGTRDEAQALSGRRLLLTSEGSTPQDIVVATEQSELDAASGPVGDQRMWPLQLGIVPEASPTGFDENAPTVTVFGNIVDASEGETHTEKAIGSGDTRLAFQTFALPKAPLTYLSDPVRSPPYSAELEIRVDGRLWQAVETFFDQPPEAEVYVIRQSDDVDYVQFGDGKNGARLSSGRNNITARYRSGHGSWGDLAGDAQATAKDNLKPLKNVLMPGPATGGALPETMSTSRAAAPGRMQSLGRLVGLSDYEAEALAVPGVLKAGAVFSSNAQWPSITLTVLTEDESAEAIAAVKDALHHADRCRGPNRYPLDIIAGRRRYLHLALTLGYDPAYRSIDLDAGIAAALGAIPEYDNEPPTNGLFSLSQRRFGQDVHISQVIASAQSVEGVKWVRPSAFASLTDSSDNPLEIAVPKNAGLSTRISLSHTEVLALSQVHLTLEASTVINDEECQS